MDVAFILDKYFKGTAESLNVMKTPRHVACMSESFCTFAAEMKIPDQ